MVVCDYEIVCSHLCFDPSINFSKITVQGGSTMHMTKAGAALYQADKSARLIREKRLSLVLDIDHTLLHATDDRTASEYPGTDTRSFFLRKCGRMHYIKLRPNLLQFLKEAVSVSYSEEFPQLSIR